MHTYIQTYIYAYIHIIHITYHKQKSKVNCVNMCIYVGGVVFLRQGLSVWQKGI